jgi:hypothetical protein
MNIRTAALPVVLSAALGAAVVAPAGTALAGVKWTPAGHSSSAPLTTDPGKKMKVSPLDTVTTGKKGCVVVGALDYLVSLTWARPTSTAARPVIVNISQADPGGGISRLVWRATTTYAGVTEEAHPGGVVKGSFTFTPGKLAKRSVSATVTLYGKDTGGRDFKLCTTTPSTSG